MTRSDETHSPIWSISLLCRSSLLRLTSTTGLSQLLTHVASIAILAVGINPSRETDSPSILPEPPSRFRVRLGGRFPERECSIATRWYDGNPAGIGQGSIAKLRASGQRMRLENGDRRPRKDFQYSRPARRYKPTRLSPSLSIPFPPQFPNADREQVRSQDRNLSYGRPRRKSHFGIGVGMGIGCQGSLR